MAPKEISMHATIRKGIAGALIATILAVSSAAVATAVSPGPVNGGPAGNGACAAQAAAARAARTTRTVAAFRAFGDCEISRRLATLTTLSGIVSGAKGMTTSDKAALVAELGSTRSGLTALKATIDSQTSIPALKLDIVAIDAKFRVYLLVAPQVDLARAADDVVALQPHFASISTNLAARIATAQGNGKDVSAAQTALADMNAKVAAAAALAAPVPQKLLPLTAAQFNAGIAGPIVTGARNSVAQARDDLKAAVADGKAVVADLK